MRRTASCCRPRPKRRPPSPGAATSRGRGHPLPVHARPLRGGVRAARDRDQLRRAAGADRRRPATRAGPQGRAAARRCAGRRRRGRRPVDAVREPRRRRAPPGGLGDAYAGRSGRGDRPPAAKPAISAWSSIRPATAAAPGRRPTKPQPSGGQALLGGAVHRVLVELRQHVLAEGLHRLLAGLDRHGRRQHAEGQLVGTGVDEALDRPGHLVGVADGDRRRSRWSRRSARRPWPG